MHFRMRAHKFVGNCSAGQGPGRTLVSKMDRTFVNRELTQATWSGNDRLDF